MVPIILGFTNEWSEEANVHVVGVKALAESSIVLVLTGALLSTGILLCNAVVSVLETSCCSCDKSTPTKQ